MSRPKHLFNKHLLRYFMIELVYLPRSWCNRIMTGIRVIKYYISRNNKEMLTKTAQCRIPDNLYVKHTLSSMIYRQIKYLPDNC